VFGQPRLVERCSVAVRRPPVSDEPHQRSRCPVQLIDGHGSSATTRALREPPCRACGREATASGPFLLVSGVGRSPLADRTCYRPVNRSLVCVDSQNVCQSKSGSMAVDRPTRLSAPDRPHRPPGALGKTVDRWASPTADGDRCYSTVVLQGDLEVANPHVAPDWISDLEVPGARWMTANCTSFV
jgi:hypothetical protein